MPIRRETSGDQAAISHVITLAFLEAEHRGGNEAMIVEKLREAGGLSVSLVATEDDRIVGHIAFSPATIDDRETGWFGLGPVAVVPNRQRQGIGRQLIKAGLDELRARGSQGCVVLGNPAYYG